MAIVAIAPGMFLAHSVVPSSGSTAISTRGPCLFPTVSPMNSMGETVGNKHGPKVDIAVDPLEGTTLCAKNMPGAIATMAVAEEGTLLNAPDVYMEKIAIGPGYPKGVVDLDAPAEENIRNLAKAKDIKTAEITALILDRPRHADLIAAVRRAGATVSL